MVSGGGPSGRGESGPRRRNRTRGDLRDLGSQRGRHGRTSSCDWPISTPFLVLSLRRRYCEWVLSLRHRSDRALSRESDADLYKDLGLGILRRCRG